MPLNRLCSSCEQLILRGTVVACRYHINFDIQSGTLVYKNNDEVALRAFILEFFHTRVHPLLFRFLDEIKKLNPREVLAVGGVGRDLYYAFLTGKSPAEVDNKEVDIEIYGVPFDKVVETAKKVGRVTVHQQSFVVAKLWFGNGEDDCFDLSSPRRERYVAMMHCSTCDSKIPYPDVPGDMRCAHICPVCNAKTLKNIGDRHDYDVQEDHNISISEAAERRDTTMNAMGISLLDGRLHDPYGGKEDIRNKIVRYVSKTTFPQDELRFWRAARQAAKFGFKIDRGIYDLAMEYVDRQPYLDKSRIVSEAIKMLTSGRRFQDAFDFLIASKWIQVENPTRVIENARKLDDYLESLRQDGKPHPVSNSEKYPYRRAIWNGAVILNGEPVSSFSHNFKTITYMELPEGFKANDNRKRDGHSKIHEDYKAYNRLYAEFDEILNAPILDKSNVLYMLPDSQRPDRFTWEEIIAARQLLGRPAPKKSALDILKHYNYQVPPKILRGNEIEAILNEEGVHIQKKPSKNNRGTDGIVVEPAKLGEIDRLIRSKQLQGEIYTLDEAITTVQKWIADFKSQIAEK